MAQAQACLDASAHEIDVYLSYIEVPPVLTGGPLAIVTETNYARASEYWRANPFGALSQGVDVAPVLTARDSFARHRATLMTLKTDWGVG